MFHLVWNLDNFAQTRVACDNDRGDDTELALRARIADMPDDDLMSMPSERCEEPLGAGLESPSSSYAAGAEPMWISFASPVGFRDSACSVSARRRSV